MVKRWQGTHVNFQHSQGQNPSTKYTFFQESACYYHREYESIISLISFDCAIYTTFDSYLVRFCHLHAKVLYGRLPSHLVCKRCLVHTLWTDSILSFIGFSFLFIAKCSDIEILLFARQHILVYPFFVRHIIYLASGWIFWFLMFLGLI